MSWLKRTSAFVGILFFGIAIQSQSAKADCSQYQDLQCSNAGGACFTASCDATDPPTCSGNGDDFNLGAWTYPGPGCRCRTVEGVLLASCQRGTGMGTCTETRCEAVGPASGATPTPTPVSGGATSGGATSGGATSGGATSGGSVSGGSASGGSAPAPTPTPHIACPGDSTVDTSSWDKCNCTVGGAQFTVSGTTGICSCPSDYEKVPVGGGSIECRPVLPPEMFRNAATDYFPACGAGRLPIRIFNGYGVSINAASNGRPNSSEKFTANGFDYKHATGTTAPNYLYKNYTQCACTARSISDGTNIANGSTETTRDESGGNVRFPINSAAQINLQTNSANIKYSPVVIAKDENVDGRLGVFYNNPSGYSKCECPNLNETFSEVGTDAGPMGSVCTPTVNNASGFRILTTFSPKAHDHPSRSQVMNRGSAQKSSGDNLVKAVKLSATEKYTRKIWACMDPYTVDTSTGNCVFVPTIHACDAGNGADAEASAVSENVSGVTAANRFNNAKNKKLACCLNQFGRDSTLTKFDCVQTQNKNYADFNALWSSADTSEQGGQLNAIILTNNQGKDVSGFYTLTGSRCDQFSEFAGEIQPGMVNSALGIGVQSKRANGKLDTNTFEAKGAPIPLPGSGTGNGSSAFTFIQSRITGAGKSIPSSAIDRRRCPVLVRAAMVATCPTGGPPNSYTSGATVRCASATQVDIHVRIEQVWEISGQPKLATIDSIVDGVGSNGQKTMAGNISIDQIIANKTGGQCPPGQTRNTGSGACEY